MSDTPKPTDVEVFIDGQSVTVAPGSTILKAAEKVGKTIPHFCYHPGLPIVGQCRMCFVEIEGAPKLATACSMPVAPGMKVLTESEKVKAGQNGTLEFILLNHPLDCPICDRGGECKLQDYTYEYGPPRSRMEDEKVLRDKHRHVSEEIILDQERCILCTRCVRFSSSVDGRTELVVNQRGNASAIDVFEGRPMESKFSGNVVDICPVGALTAQDFRFAARPWELKTHAALCTGCSVGCNVHIDTKHRHPGIARPDHLPPSPKIVRLRPRENPQVNTWWMCDEGRWGYHFHNDAEKRLTHPLLRRSKNAALEKVSLREAQLFLEESGRSTQSWEFWVDDTLPHEGLSWAKELLNSWTNRGRSVRGLNPHPFAQEFLAFWASRMNSPWTAGSVDWTGIQTILSPLADYRALEEIAPILSLRLGPRIREGALQWKQVPLENLAKESINATTAVLVSPPTQAQEMAALAALPQDAKVLPLFTYLNGRGLLNSGVAPLEALHTSLQSASPQGPVFFFGQRTQKKILPGVLEYLKKAPFLVVTDSFHSELTDRADVVLPLTPLYESEFTATNLENRQQKSAGVHLHHPNTPSIERGSTLVSASLRLL